jgi:hypothetical protein
MSETKSNTKFVAMNVSYDMVSSVLSAGGSIVCPPSKRNRNRNSKSRKEYSLEKSHFHSINLKTPTTIYVPNAECEPLSLITQNIISQLTEKGIRIGTKIRQLNYSIANKHRNSGITIIFTGEVDSFEYKILVVQGLKVILSESDTNNATIGFSSSSFQNFGEFDDWEDIPASPSSIPNGILPPFDLTPPENLQKSYSFEDEDEINEDDEYDYSDNKDSDNKED